MIANIISRYTYQLTDVVTVSDYSITSDSIYGGKSLFVFARKLEAAEDDFIIIRGSGILYQGIISTIENEDGKNSYTITAIEMPRLFDQKVILSNETLLSTGIEDFIADQISGNFITNSDEIVNITYLTVTAKTHTPVAGAISADDGGIYNLCEFMADALTNHGIFIDFEFTQEALNVTIEKKVQADLKIDTGTSDIINLYENTEVKALAKLTVIWQQTAGEVTTETIRHFFLKTDRSITETATDPDRANGTTDIIISSQQTEEGMKQEAYDKFTANAYNHKVNFDFKTDSKLIKADEMYVGHKCQVKTKNGIKNSIVTAITCRNQNKAINVTLGAMKVTLIEKLKGVEAK